MTDRLGQNAIQALASGGIRQLSAQGSNSTVGIKWHPGHYLGTRAHIYAGFAATPTEANWVAVQQEISTVLSSGPAVQGWVGDYSLAALEPTTLGTYTGLTPGTGWFDQIYTLITGISKPGDTPTGKRMALRKESCISYSGANYGRIAPAYMLADTATYGIGPPGSPSSGGCWSINNNTMAILAFWRSPVMNRVIASDQAIAGHVTPGGFPVDQDPYFEFMGGWEITAPTVPDAGSSGYTQAGYLIQVQNWITSTVAAFPHTTVIALNNYVSGDKVACANLTNFLRNNRAGISSPDLFGQTCILNQAGNNTGINVDGSLTTGYRAFIGSANAGASFPAGYADLRGQMPCVVIVEDPELTGSGFHGYGSPWTPLDIFINARDTLSLPNNLGGVSHMVWTIITGNSVAVQDPTTKRNTGTNPGNVGSILNVINSNVIPFTGAPASYAAINTT